jgi:uncharacterized protein (TIGR03083 family)
VNAVTRQTTSLDFVEEFVAAAERLAVAVAWSDPRAPVPGCPGWTAYDLVVHLGNVHAWAATIVETGESAVEQNDEPRSAKPRVLSEWYAGKAEDLYEVLKVAAPDMPCWNFVFGSGVAGFWQRRQLHETTIHHLDLDLAAGREPTQVDPRIAADGVDEVLTVFLHRMHQRGHPAALDRPLLVSATDSGDEWLVSPPPRAASTTMVPAQPEGTTAETVPHPPVVVRRSRHAAEDAVDRLEAPAGTLYRLLWKRLPVDEAGLRLEGDEARVRAFLGSRLVP